MQDRRNWWRIGFFILLFIVEAERELIVVASDDAKPLVTKSIYTYGDWTVAEGQWVRADGGDKLTPQAVHFDCQKDEGTCRVASYQMHEGYGYRPELDTFDATFSDGTITMKSKGDCFSTVTRIDLTTKEATQTRLKSEGWKEAFAKAPELQKVCSQMEDRLVARLSGYDDPSLKIDPLKGHFVPILSALFWAFA